MIFSMRAREIAWVLCNQVDPLNVFYSFIKVLRNNYAILSPRYKIISM